MLPQAQTDRWWEHVDWSRPNADIAREVGVSRQAVHQARRRHGRAPNPRARTRPTSPELSSRMYRIRATPATHRALERVGGPGRLGLALEALLPELRAPQAPARSGRVTRLYRIYTTDEVHAWLRAHTPLQVGEALKERRRRLKPPAPEGADR